MHPMSLSCVSQLLIVLQVALNQESFSAGSRLKHQDSHLQSFSKHLLLQANLQSLLHSR